MPIIASILPAYAQQANPAQVQAISGSFADLGYIYDPLPEHLSPSLSQLPGATNAAYINAPDTTYSTSRAWPVGATPDQIFKVGDLKGNPQFAGFHNKTLGQLSRTVGTDIAGIPLKNVEVLNGTTLADLKRLYQLDDVKIKDGLAVAPLFLGVILNPAGSAKQIKKNALSFGAQALIKRLRKEKALKDIPFERLLQGDWRGAIKQGEEVYLREVAGKLPDYLQRVPVGNLSIAIIEGDFTSLQNQAIEYGINEITELTYDEILTQFPELQEIPISVVSSIANQPLSHSLPKVVDFTIEQLKVDDKLLSSLPGLSDSPVDKLIGNTLLNFILGDVFVRLDFAHTGEDGAEFHNGRAITGGTKGGSLKPEPGIRSTTSKTKSTKGMPRIEAKPTEGGGLGGILGIGKDSVLGKEIMMREQQVPGCQGTFFCLISKWEPAGVKPVPGSLFKISLGDLQSFDDKSFTARVYVDFQFCAVIFFEKNCVPHIISSPTPWKVTNNSLFLVLTRRTAADVFPGINEQARLVNACLPPNYFGQSTAGSSPPPKNNATPKADIPGLIAKGKAAGYDFRVTDQGNVQVPVGIGRARGAETEKFIIKYAAEYGLQAGKSQAGDVILTSLPQQPAQQASAAQPSQQAALPNGLQQAGNASINSPQTQSVFGNKPGTSLPANRVSPPRNAGNNASGSLSNSSNNASGNLSNTSTTNVEEQI